MKNWLQGKKTYIIAFASAIYGAGIATGLWSHYPAIDLILGGGAAASLRAGISNSANKVSALIAAAALSAIVLAGCATPHLANGGAYAPGAVNVSTNADGSTITNFVASSSPNLALYYADASYSTAYAIVDGAFQWEKQNRTQLFALDPDIKHQLDAIRPAAWDVNQRWALARKAYLQSPIPANLTAIQQIIAQVQALVPAVQAAQGLALTSTNSVTH